jgi:hypothetical protein
MATAGLQRRARKEGMVEGGVLEMVAQSAIWRGAETSDEAEPEEEEAGEDKRPPKQVA